MKVIEVLNVRRLYKDIQDVDFSDDLSIKISTFLNESEFVEIQYSKMEESLLYEYGELTENKFNIITGDNGINYVKLKKESRDDFHKKITTILTAQASFHLDDSMKLTDNDIGEILERCRDSIQESDIRKVLDPIRTSYE